ncbi:hypothetical protein G9298_17880 [Bacillus thuringiensis]|nr:hypothetical protein G9298_17880 [Bacillus thuringiensis]
MANNYNEVKQEVIKEMEERYGLIPGFFQEDKQAKAIFLNKGKYDSSVWLEGEGLFYMDDVPWTKCVLTDGAHDNVTPVMLRRHGNWVHITGAVRNITNQRVFTRLTPDIAPRQESYFAATAFLDDDPNRPVAASVVVYADGRVSTWLPVTTARYVSFSLTYPIK